MIKLIASDMDGTLLNSKKKINNEFYTILKQLKEDNIIFTAISGRDIFSLKKVFKDIDEDIVFAANNGNYIEYKGKVIFENYIQKDKLKNIAIVVRKFFKHNTLYCGKDIIYSESKVAKFIGILWGLNIKYTKDIMKIKDNIIKVTVFGKPSDINKNRENLKILNNEFMVTISGRFSIDICRYGGNKKNGIEIIKNKFNIKYDETMVFGDNMNDLEMMASAYYSFAMENAKDKVKSNARFIAKSNDDNGVVEAIKEVALVNEKAKL